MYLKGYRPNRSIYIVHTNKCTAQQSRHFLHVSCLMWHNAAACWLMWHVQQSPQSTGNTWWAGDSWCLCRGVRYQLIDRFVDWFTPAIDTTFQTVHIVAEYDSLEGLWGAHGIENVRSIKKRGEGGWGGGGGHFFLLCYRFSDVSCPPTPLSRISVIFRRQLLRSTNTMLRQRQRLTVSCTCIGLEDVDWVP